MIQSVQRWIYCIRCIPIVRSRLNLTLNSWFLCSNSVKRRVGKHSLMKLQLIIWKHFEAKRMSHKTHLVQETWIVFNWNSVYFWFAERHLNAFLWNFFNELNIFTEYYPTCLANFVLNSYSFRFCGVEFCTFDAMDLSNIWKIFWIQGDSLGILSFQHFNLDLSATNADGIFDIDLTCYIFIRYKSHNWMMAFQSSFSYFILTRSGYFVSEQYCIFLIHDNTHCIRMLQSL